MKRVLLYTVACLASLTARYAEAQVPIGQVQAFSSAAPAVTSFSSKSVGGVGGTYATVALIDPDIQTNTAASINTALITAAAAAPGGNGIAQWSSGGGYVLTRPTGNGFTILMATVTNNTGGSLSSVVISYVLGLPSVLAGEDAELQGHRVFYSTTGAANSWTLIPGLTSPQGPNPIPAGSLLATVSIGTLPVNGLLYIIWVDDNGGPGTDGSFSIDNFLVSTSIACPTVTTQPSNTTNAVGRTVSLSVVASGPGLTYAWNKVGSGPIDTTANPSAATPTLVINNADTSVTGDYFVAIANTCGSVNSANAHIQVNADTVPPRFLSASATGTRSFRLVVDEPLCVDPRPLDQGGCLADARDTFNWQIIDGTDLVTDLGVVTATVVDGTNVDFTVNTDRVN